ncbi:uncharacterized protein BDW43DRAFT_178525 [Aspergillus alliaceus]|uniref:uncharacterized protein n=1 Tax=Petromyces alliaceus TaxID=209559 RepID=UPI0012A4340B|nr:uncharacterized protein BDW43DRAFT_178525 [Aspergillus alliaceus]KAB8229828.1 hypothetical protein BDW43DRAFT_178525 [Aspergillus alliaceus]
MLVKDGDLPNEPCLRKIAFQQPTNCTCVLLQQLRRDTVGASGTGINVTTAEWPAPSFPLRVIPLPPIVSCTHTTIFGTASICRALCVKLRGRKIWKKEKPKRKITPPPPYFLC